MTNPDILSKVNHESPPGSHVLVIEDSTAIRTVFLEEATYSVGRDLSNSIVIDSKKVSRHHATLLRRTNVKTNHYSFWILDGDLQGNRSTNGIFVNNKKCLVQEIKHGDVINFGDEVKANYYIITNLSEQLFLTSGNLKNPHPASASSPASKQNTMLLSELDPEPSRNADLVKLASFPEASPNPIIEIDWEGTITYVNPAANQKFQDLYQAKLEHPILAGLLSNSMERQDNLLVREVKVGSELFEEYVQYLSESQLIRIYLFDLSKHQQVGAGDRESSVLDLVTGLPKQKLFEEQLSTAIANAGRNQNLLVLMSIDLDRFQNINNTLGRDRGNRLLKGFAGRLRACFRSGDIVARWREDRFVVLLPQVASVKDTAKIAKRILNAMRQPFELGEQPIHINNNVGIAVCPQDGQDAQTLLKYAETALYRSKDQELNSYHFYNPAMNDETAWLLRLENFLHQALEKEEFFLTYQPQVNLNNGKLTGMEALLRWQHPELGTMSPGTFLCLAEETNLIVSIGEWVLSTACAQNKAWQEAGLLPLPIAVNLSPRQFQQMNLTTKVVEILEQTGLEPQWLELEITESAIAQDVGAAFQTLRRLQEIGVRLGMDDFGTGSVAIGYLQQFPFHRLKINQSFIENFGGDNTKDLAMLSALIAFGRSFNIKVLAEGIETQQQLELLRSLQCDELQGYYFSKPLRVEEVTKFLASYKSSTA